MAVVESGFEAGDFGTEPARKITVGMNRDSDLTLLYNGVNLDGAKRVRANSHMHLGAHLNIGGEVWLRSPNRWSRRRGIHHLVNS